MQSFLPSFIRSPNGRKDISKTKQNKKTKLERGKNHMKRILKLKQPNYLHKDPNGHLLGSLYPFRPDIYCKDCDKFYKKIDMLKLNPKTMLPARVYRMRKIDIEQRRLAKIERKIQREGSNISKMIKSLATPLIEKEQVMLSK